MKTKALFMALALALSTGFASANDIQVNAGAITQDTAHPYGHLFTHDPGTFTDTIDFTIPSGSVQSSANPLLVSLGGTDIYKIINLAYSVYDGTSSSAGASYGTFLGDNMTHDLALAGAGPYHIIVSGLADGSLGGSYGVALVSGVPEPETYAMMLGGLGLIGIIARRRKSQG
ncbi:FxDxF family PEP-CTERM protein [Duganella violaceipulchra]|uniref:FxDxF family PEP-CTERM protein n=1 Tax=Duganella violaceipulchra TaxID=2849652 RepID=A0AA41HEF6_9BURK|nr:FxDxF family PEP-CTERM protein [Duganella violaceicalia]MBV6323522.1 FxDxF family PEP-CTERM protein [Duganella violaceicalia]MCP2008876.1 hypothetical protein [Duganella violaceicalia]